MPNIWGACFDDLAWKSANHGTSGLCLFTRLIELELHHNSRWMSPLVIDFFHLISTTMLVSVIQYINTLPDSTHQERDTEYDLIFNIASFSERQY